MRSAPAEIRRRLRALGSPEDAAFVARYFKTGKGEYGEGDRFHGVRVGPLRKLAREFRDVDLDALEQLLDSPWHEERLVALVIMSNRADDRDVVRLYLRKTDRINNWDLVDCSARSVIGPNCTPSLLTKLAKSKLLWERRIAIIATQHFIRDGKFDETLRIADLLLSDEHDLIHKATGWMLREVGNRDRATLEKFLDTRAPRMPRTMLRYAIERFPQELRRRYLSIRGESGGSRSSSRR
ncbi:MAG TPA: DNA alkylation repair protein [Vicinamibacterales bacterium]